MLSPYRSDLLAGKNVFITGGGTGINYGIAEACAKHGANLAIMGRRKEVLDQAVESLAEFGGKIVVHQGDVRDPENCESAIEYAVDQLGGLDALVNGAAGNFLCPPEMLSPNAFKTVIDIDLQGTFQMSRCAYEHLKKSRGVILNISATLHYQGTFNQLHVSAAKAGVDALTKNLACEWGVHGIRVVGIAPGPIADTEGMKRLGQGMEKKIGAQIPLQRMGKCIEIANSALFLMSTAASYITGETIVVDGGQWLYKAPWVPREMVEELVVKSQNSST